MIEMNERFLEDIGSDFKIDSIMPLRLQKRAVLESLGFPGNPDLRTCRSCDSAVVKHLVSEYSKDGYPFLIIVSEKPMNTLIPPLFVVKSPMEVVWRDDRGRKKIISLREAMAVIRSYLRTTWLEFSPFLWGSNTIGGRLLYMGANSQVLEMQRGAIPAALVNDRSLRTFTGGLSYLDIERCDYLEICEHLKLVGFKDLFPFNAVRYVCKKMQRRLASFEKLNEISDLPTLEFAITGTGRFVSIDIDWPAQWVTRIKTIKN